MRKALIGLLAAGVIMTGTACEAWKEDRGRGDAPVGLTNDDAATIINFPDQFPNIATKCDGLGHRLFVHTRTDNAQGATIVVIDDPAC